VGGDAGGLALFILFVVAGDGFALSNSNSATIEAGRIALIGGEPIC